MKILKQILPLVFVVILGVGLFFVVNANKDQVKKIEESSRAQAAQEASKTVTTTGNIVTNEAESKAKTVKAKTVNTFVITPKHNNIKYPVTSILTAKRVLATTYKSTIANFVVKSDFTKYYKSINNDSVYKNKTVYFVTYKFKNSNSKHTVTSVKYSGAELYVTIKETKAKKPNNKAVTKLFAIRVNNSEFNAKGIMHITVKAS